MFKVTYRYGLTMQASMLVTASSATEAKAIVVAKGYNVLAVEAY